MGEGQCEKAITTKLLIENMTMYESLLTVNFVVLQIQEGKILYCGERQIVFTTAKSQNAIRMVVKELMLMCQEIEQTVVAVEEKGPVHYPFCI